MPRKNTELVGTRITLEQKEILTALREERGISASEYLREVLEAHFADEAEKRAVK